MIPPPSRNLRMASASSPIATPERRSRLKNVLAKYPDQDSRVVWPRAGRAAGSQRSARERKFFGRLTTGEHAATQDPMVLAWSHVIWQEFWTMKFLEQSKSEYQAALSVQGAPTKAQQAAQRNWVT